MSEYVAVVKWERGSQPFSDKRYSRAHSWRFDGGVEVAASASPSIVPLPMSRADAVDPEEAFVAAVSSCHMLCFLSVAAKSRFVVDSYEDHAVGIIEKNPKGKVAVTRVKLEPLAIFSGASIPAKHEVERMHHQAHEQCFIASSVLTDIICEPQIKKRPNKAPEPTRAAVTATRVAHL